MEISHQENNSMNRTAHVIGIGGYGMSAVAKVFLEQGFRVTGSDVSKSALAEKLIDLGAEVHIGHDAKWVHGADVVVYSTAIAKDHEELVEARKLGIPLRHRAEQLAEFLHAGKGIAVAGAHGKTTTSSMIAHVLIEAGKDPSFLIGGEVINAGTNAHAGSGEWIVAEADESDGSFLNYHPWLTVVTNMEPDHLEHYEGTYDRLKEAYQQFVKQIQRDGFAVLCADDADVRALGMGLNASVIWYGLNAEQSLDLDWHAEEIQLGDRQSRFIVKHRGETWAEVQLKVPGLHNVQNSLAAIATAVQCGASKDAIVHALARFGGAKRRFQVIGETADFLVVDDYAHHPTEIKATLRAAKETGRRVVAIFQPQRYSRTYFLFEEFAESFQDADVAILTAIYSPAGEQVIERVSTQHLIQRIHERQLAPSELLYAENLDVAYELLQQFTRPGDLVLTMGAGDVWKTAVRFWNAIHEKR